MTRIIGGEAGGRRLKTPTGEATRPTSDRVREALFSSLEAQLGTLTGHSLLDLYAGTGAIGLEAKSRGATRVRAVEGDRRTAALVAENATTLGYGDVRVDAQLVRTALSHRADAPYDVVFSDPPYPLTEDELAQDLQDLVSNGWLADGSLIVIERGRRSPEPRLPQGLRLHRTKKYGETVLWYVRAELPH